MNWHGQHHYDLRNENGGIVHVLAKMLIMIGKILAVIGVVVFITSRQNGTSHYDYTETLSQPQPMSGHTTLLAENDRVYVFSEAMSAVNVYEESGAFLFCVRGERNQNGIGEMFLFGTDIYIVSRNDVIFRFDENGTYLGRADRDWLYDQNDQKMMSLYVATGGVHKTPVFFDDTGVWHYAWYDDIQARMLFYYDGVRLKELGEVEPMKNGRIAMNDCLYADSSYSITDENVAYNVLSNQVYQVVGNEETVFAETPLYQYYMKSPTLGWITGLLGTIMIALGTKLYKQKEREITTYSANYVSPDVATDRTMEGTSSGDENAEYKISIHPIVAMFFGSGFVCWGLFLSYMTIISYKGSLLNYILSYGFMVFGLLLVTYVLLNGRRSYLIVNHATFTRYFVFRVPKTYYIKDVTKVVRHGSTYRIYIGKKKVFDLENGMENGNCLIVTFQENNVPFKKSLF